MSPDLACEASNQSSNHGIGFQEEIGRARKSIGWKMDCVVIAEHWPSWSFVLQSMMVQRLDTLLPVAAGRTVREIMETTVGGTVVRNAASVLDAAALDRRWKHSVVFIQGSEFFVSDIRMRLKDSNEAGLFGIMPDEGSRRKAKGPMQGWEETSPLLIKHSQSGGVTRGRWRVYSDLKLTGLKSSQVKRVLSHILVSTESGPSIHPTTANSGDYIGPEQRIPICKRNLRLAVPSCFSRGPNKLVERDISNRELMSAYDLEEGVQKALTSYSNHTKLPLSRDFVLEAPLKVLHMVTGVIKSSLDSVSDHEGSMETDCNNEGSMLSTSRKCLRDKDLEVMDIPHKLPRRLEVRPEGEDVNNQIASKNDDAPVDRADWDIWTVNNFTPPEVRYSKGESSSRVMFKEATGCKVLICKLGTYHQDTHGRLFDALRSLLIRRARRNAFKGSSSTCELNMEVL